MSSSYRRNKKLTDKQRRFLGAMGVLGGLGLGAAGIGAGVVGAKYGARLGGRIGKAIGKKRALKWMKKYRKGPHKDMKFQSKETRKRIGSGRRYNVRETIASDARKNRRRGDFAGYFGAFSGTVAAGSALAQKKYFGPKEKKYMKQNRRNKRKKR